MKLLQIGKILKLFSFAPDLIETLGPNPNATIVLKCF